jgi:hypothetical protein
VIAPHFITDLLCFRQLGPPLWLPLNVFAPGCVGNSLNAAGRAVIGAFTDQNDHATESRFGVELTKRLIDLSVEAGARVFGGVNYACWGYVTGRMRTDEECLA